MSRKIYLCISVPVFVSIIFRATVSLSAVQTETKDFIIAAVRQNESLIRNFETRFSIEFLGPDGNVKYDESTTPEVIITEDYYYAREGGKLYSKYSKSFNNGLTTETEMLYKENTMKFYSPTLNSGLIQSKKRFPTPVVPDRFSNLYRNVKDMTMSEFLEASTIKRIEPCDIEGHKGFMVEVVHCHSSETTPVDQKIYFDAERGFVPVTVETYRLDISEEKPTLVAKVLEFKKFDNGVYFPVKARLDSFKRDESGKLKMSGSVLCSTKDTKINTELSSDIFELKYPQGTDVYDERLDLGYTVGITQKSLDDIEIYVETKRFNIGEVSVAPENAPDLKKPEVNLLKRTSESEDISSNNNTTILVTDIESSHIFGNRLFWFVSIVTAATIIAMTKARHIRKKRDNVEV